MAKEKKYEIKISKDHGGKQFESSFRLIGQVKAVRKKEEGTENWIDQPLYEQKPTKSSGKPRRNLQFNIETARGNELRVETNGMEKEFAFAYSSTHKKSIRIKWDNRFERDKWKDENKKVLDKEIDDTYHLMTTDWEKTLELSEQVKVGDWVQVKGHYDPNEFTTNDGHERNSLKRMIDYINPIVDGKLKIGDELKDIKHGGKDIVYVTDFNDPNFEEVNSFSMQIGIRSTYQDETTKDTKVNGTLLTYGKTRSEPKDVEMMVYYKEPEKGKSLAEAFASLEQGDFIESTGQDNNRATYTYVEVEEVIDDSDPFSEVDDTQKVKRKQRVTNGEKKGLEVTGYVAGSIMRGLLTEEEMRKTVETTSQAPFDLSDDSDPFKDVNGGSEDDPFKE